MSEFIKPENECPFDPKQYQCDCFIAPVSSFSWALIQLKLRKRVTRSVWVNCKGNNEMYLTITPRVNDLTVEKDSAYAVDGVAIETKYDYLTHIDLRNEHGNFVPWQPTQEDMMACDWKFVEDNRKPEIEPFPEPALRMKGKLTLGRLQDSNFKLLEYIGYGRGDKGIFDFGDWEGIGVNTLTEELNYFYFKSKKSTEDFRRFDFGIDYKKIGFNKRDEIHKKLESKNLIISCLGEDYKFTSAKLGVLGLEYSEENNPATEKLGKLFKENIGKTLEIEFTFEDKLS
ncbi:DUF2829 domain-containing protein [Xenorhabdus sp. 42]|uniref:DUF2829 domain-containing protein n=1 Tax=Xenorhabdus szentirmaii TaxID=290112 RepID=UPI0019BCB4DD|nr:MULTISPECIES: DUF2829 domain-containing protein [unclassified Xenorhabdus]MBD2794038.1 DUF2829 domain-containing protein [Xenorhabdus sp. CUL]MBD2819337.1 DUF2829 domain-containing protein [Xenorhabdus sp. 42]MBD2827051.1 DUF2829 domain-containing protein [Xenorhabdus sp. 5]